MAAVKPTAQQIEWAKQEIGVIIHYDITVFEPSYQFRKQWGYHPDPRVFAPTQLDTDQWIRTAKSAGANYAILVAKHCTGFCLWPTDAHPYSVKNAGYQGDIVKQFVESCQKYGVKPGLYYSTACNGYCNVDNPGTVRSGSEEEQQAYNRIVEQQLTELWSRYGQLFEIWFDGGLLAPEKGGPAVRELYEKWQPQAVRFQGSAINLSNNLRWSGNEEGHVPVDCWSTVTLDSQFDGLTADHKIGQGTPDGTRWAPVECDMPNRKLQWFWHEGEDRKVFSPSLLLDRYERSVGHNANLLLGMVIDNRGLVPDADATAFSAFGEAVRARYGSPAAVTSGAAGTLQLKLPREMKVDRVVLEEDLTDGHQVNGFVVECLVRGKWRKVFSAKVIGHKRIARFAAKRAQAVRVRVENSQDAPICRFAAYEAEGRRFFG